MAGGALDVADRLLATFLTKNSAKSSTEWPDVKRKERSLFGNQNYRMGNDKSECVFNRPRVDENTRRGTMTL